MARGEDTEDSDLDLLVILQENASLLDIGAIQYEISELLGRQVDILTPGSLPLQWREDVLKEARPI